ncbi:MAG: hypothetical protein WCT44_02220 [Candidatus Paceibacterota bacterium]
MQSTTYKIITDSVNVGGDDNSASTNYIIGDTLGELSSGDSNSANYYMHAGFWQMQSSYISITSPSDLALTSIGGINGENTEGTMSWTVLTDNVAGYSMSIKTLTSPALASAEDSFDDYAPAGADPDYNFSIATSVSEFGFTPEGADTNSRFKDNGSSCNTGSGETSAKCWDGLSLVDKIIAGKSSSNHPSGSTTTVRFRAESGSAHIQTSGAYSASIVVTAVTL